MRRRAAPKRSILPDPVYKSELLAKFVNHVMKDGKKSVAESIIYGALTEVVEKVKSVKKDAKHDDEGGESGSTTVGGALTPIELFTQILENIKPQVEVKSRRVGGSTYQVPVEVSPIRSRTLAMRWLVESAQKRSEKSMSHRLAAEMADAFQGRGTAVKKREDMHKMAKANQAFAHYRW
jgi:small subunit ribosomal protein S7